MGGRSIKQLSKDAANASNRSMLVSMRYQIKQRFDAESFALCEPF
jgi:hypothetical protein